MTRRITAVAGLILILAGLLLWGDRPIALWFDAHFHGSNLERVLIAGFGALDWILVFAAVALMFGIAMLRLRPGNERLMRLVSGGIAAGIALVLTEVVKFVVGRSQVYPDFLRDGIYAFHPMQFGGFPSATMAGVTAFLIGLGMRPPIRRPVVAAANVFVAFALLVTSGHWASDIVAGTVLGFLTGRATTSTKLSRS